MGFGLAISLQYNLSYGLMQETFINETYNACVTVPAKNQVKGLMNTKEINKLKRSYQIKKSELEADKKALSKYKYDPQSYH